MPNGWAWVLAVAGAGALVAVQPTTNAEASMQCTYDWVCIFGNLTMGETCCDWIYVSRSERSGNAGLRR